MAAFHVLRRRRNEAQVFLYAFDLLELERHGLEAGADRGAQGNTGEACASTNSWNTQPAM